MAKAVAYFHEIAATCLLTVDGELVCFMVVLSVAVVSLDPQTGPPIARRFVEYRIGSYCINSISRNSCNIYLVSVIQSWSSMDPTGKVCIVTGGAQGFGKEVSNQLLQRGAKVCILDVSKEYGEETTTEFRSQYGEENVTFIPCDVTDKDNLEDAFNKVVSDFGGLDILINNAGIAFPRERILQINLHGAIDVMEKAITRMRIDKGGRGGVIVCTASSACFNICSTLDVYTASKLGLLGYTRCRALECGDEFGINFRIVAPTAMETKLLEGVRKMSVMKTTAPDEDLLEVPLDQAARAVLLCVEKKDLPQGALIKVVKHGNYLMYPEQMPSEKLADA